MPGPSSNGDGFVEFLDEGQVVGVEFTEGGTDVIELYVQSEASVQEVQLTEFIEDHDGRGPQGPPGASIYVTNDWGTDPNNPANGGTLPAGVLVVEIV